MQYQDIQSCVSSQERHATVQHIQELAIYWYLFIGTVNLLISALRMSTTTGRSLII